MSGILGSRVCFSNILPMFVLLASLFLANCMSGVVAEETAPSPQNVINNTDGNLGKNNSEELLGRDIGELVVKNDTDGHSKNASISEKEATTIALLNNSTSTSTVSNDIPSTDSSSTKLTTETEATASTAATPEPSKVIANTSGEKRSNEEKQPEDNPMKVPYESSKTNASTTASNDADTTLPPMDTEANPSPSENATMSTIYVELTTPKDGEAMMMEDVCDHNANCSELGSHVICKNFTCRCEENYERLHGKCLEKKELSPNMTCKNNNECNATKHLTCNVSSGRCSCMNGYSPMGPDSCGKKLGAVCDGNCDAQNSRCELVGDKSICVCEDGLTASADGTFCYGMPLLFGDVCDHSANCSIFGSHVICKHFTCQCEENYVRWHGQCLEKIDRLDAPCNVDTQVCFSESERETVNKKICFNGFCRCDSASGFVPHNGMCKKKISLLGAPCNATTHVCHQDDDGDNQTLQCHNGICQCKDIFLLQDGRCKKKIDVLGEKCSPGTEICYADSEGERRECTGGTCQCKSSFVNENGICKQKISLLGAPCNATADICYFKEDGNKQKTHCKDGVCQCKAEFALTEKKCQKLKSGNNHAEARFVGRFSWIPLTAVIAVMR